MLPISPYTLNILESIAASTILLRNAQKTYEKYKLPHQLKSKLEVERLVDKWIESLPWSSAELNLIEGILR